MTPTCVSVDRLWSPAHPRILSFRGVPVGGHVSLISVAPAEEGASCNPVPRSEPRPLGSVRPSLRVLASECPGPLGSGLDRRLVTLSAASFKQEVGEGSGLIWGEGQDVGSCCPGLKGLHPPGLGWSLGEAFLEEAATCSLDKGAGGGRGTASRGRDLRARGVTAGPRGPCGADLSSWAPWPCLLHPLFAAVAPSLSAPPPSAGWGGGRAGLGLLAGLSLVSA